MGQWVDQDEPIGGVGTSGNVPVGAQPHLHFEVRNPQGQSVRPDLQSNQQPALVPTTPMPAPMMRNDSSPRITYDENAPRTPAMAPRPAGQSAATAAMSWR